MKNFALIGAAGYIAPRHMGAIKETGNRLIAALDPSDSVGVIDSYFPDTNFFLEFERFDRYIDKLRRSVHSQQIEYVSICSPNYLHDSHVRFALRSGAHAICEKPLVLNPWNIEGLLDIEKDTGQITNTILQLRLHPSIVALRNRVQTEKLSSKYEVDLAYITARGKWYLRSWKGDAKKSGGIATNIGIHFFDMLNFLFGAVQGSIVHYRDDIKAAGFIEYQKARVRWFLSVDIDDVPAGLRNLGRRTYRSITLNGEEIDFSTGFVDLHTMSYREILDGNGFGLEESRAAVTTVSEIRNAKPVGLIGEYHPFLDASGSRFKV